MGFPIGEDRKKVLAATVEFPVSVRVEWPKGVPFTKEEAIEAAMAVVSSKMSRDVGIRGRIIWADLYAEVDSEEAEVTEVIELG